MTKPTARKPSKLRRWIEYSFLFAGIVGVGLWAASNLIPTLWQDWENLVFDRDARNQTAKLHEAPSHNAPIQPAIQANDLIGRLVIPRLHLRTIVREGVGNYTLSLAAGHIPGTAFPWQQGNVAVAGHRDTLFRGLSEIRKHDLIQFETVAKSYAYEVASTEIVQPEDVGVLKPDAEHELTLVTCYPFYYIGSAPERFIVKAREVSEVSPPPSPLQLTHADVSPPDPVHEIKSKAIPGRIDFNIPRDHSRQLAAGISMGITATDPSRQEMSGWMWLMSDRRTIWLRDRETRDPLVFYLHEDGKRRELVITQITATSVTGYLQL